jgi:hypothetical protein
MQPEIIAELTQEAERCLRRIIRQSGRAPESVCVVHPDALQTVHYFDVVRLEEHPRAWGVQFRHSETLKLPEIPHGKAPGMTVLERENARLFDAANRPDECVMWSADWERAMLWMLRGILHHATVSLHCQRLDALDKLHPAVQWMYSPGSATYEGAEWVPLGDNPCWNPPYQQD